MAEQVHSMVGLELNKSGAIASTSSNKIKSFLTVDSVVHTLFALLLFLSVN